MPVSALARWLLLTCPFWVGGCMQSGEVGEQDPKAPGELLGFFAVTGKLVDDTCGAESLAAPEIWSFEVKLSRDGTALYWLNGREAIVGEIDKSGRFEFETHLDLPLAARHGAAKGCTIVRRDSAKGALASSQASLSATLSYAYNESADSDCSEFATGSDGAPQILPCRMAYALSGDRIQP